MRWVISYDITDDKRRRKLSKLLSEYGTRVQFSIFECDISAHEQRVLSQSTRSLLDRRVDKLRWYPLCNSCLVHAVDIGTGIQPGEGREYYLV